MTIIFQLGDQFWIEQHIITFDIVPLDDSQTKTVTLDRSGILCGVTVCPRAASVIPINLIQVDTATFGSNISSFVVRANQNGGVGNGNVQGMFMVFMKKGR